MENKPDTIENNNDLENNNSTKSSFSVSEKILQLLEDPEDTENQEKIKKFYSKYLKSNLSHIKNGEDLSVFKKYFEHSTEKSPTHINGKIFSDKFEKYFPIHFPVYIESLKNDISNNSGNTDNLINNAFKKYSYILFIFGEKIKLGDLQKFMMLDITIISALYTNVSSKIQDLDNIEKII